MDRRVVIFCLAACWSGAFSGCVGGPSEEEGSDGSRLFQVPVNTGVPGPQEEPPTGDIGIPGAPRPHEEAPNGDAGIRTASDASEVTDAQESAQTGNGDAAEGQRPVIMLTGYWNPTGKMIRQFSQDPSLNPRGWAGENWEGRGYDVVSFFPDPTRGFTGVFEVDYQSTSQDFWTITDRIQPVAIMAFGAGSGPWEIEWNARNLGGTSWVPDNRLPVYPTPSPPDDSEPPGYTRHSSLPVEEIAARINALGLPGIGNDGAWVDWSGDPGAYLCEFMAYHAMWYRDRCVGGGSCNCLMAGFTHVSSFVSVESATRATEEALRVLIEALDAARVQ